MSLFYGMVEGQAETSASRRGSLKSRIKSSVQSYDGSLQMELFYKDNDPEKELCVNISYTEDNSSFYGRTIYWGTFKNLVNLLKQTRDYDCFVGEADWKLQ